jgi:hypothetical protein
LVVVREGYNPLQAINNVKAKIAELRPGLPTPASASRTLDLPVLGVAPYKAA